MDICTKVTLRQRLLPSGKITLYLDYYPAIRNPKTNRSQRLEYMGIYLYGNPTNQEQRNFNKTMLDLTMFHLRQTCLKHLYSTSE